MPPKVGQRATYAVGDKRGPSKQPPNIPGPNPKLSERQAGVESEKFGAAPKAGPPKAAKEIE